MSPRSINVSSSQFRMPPVPVRMRLKCPPGQYHPEIVPSTRNELQANRQMLLRKSAGNRQSRQSAKIPDSPQRIGKGKSSLEIEIQRRSGQGLRHGRQHIKRVEQIRHLFLQNLAHPRRLHIIRAGDLLVDIPINLPERVRQFAHLPAANQACGKKPPLRSP